MGGAFCCSRGRRASDGILRAATAAVVSGNFMDWQPEPSVGAAVDGQPAIKHENYAPLPIRQSKEIRVAHLHVFGAIEGGFCGGKLARLRSSCFAAPIRHRANG